MKASWKGREVLEAQSLMEEGLLRHSDTSIGTSHPGSLNINDPAPHTPSHLKLFHIACMHKSTDTWSRSPGRT